MRTYAHGQRTYAHGQRTYVHRERTYVHGERVEYRQQEPQWHARLVGAVRPESVGARRVTQPRHHVQRRR